MKIYCEECNGSGKLVELLRYREVCDKCNGQGYTENEELERLAEVGRATEKAFYFGGWIQLPLYDDIDTSEDLLEWYKEPKL